MAFQIGSPIPFTAYGADLNYGFKAEGDGTYGLSPITSPDDNFWSGNSMFSQPTNYNQWANPFGSLGGAASKAMGGFGQAPLAGPNIAQTLTGMAAITAAEEANRRKIDTAYYKLGDEWSRFNNARNWLGEGTLLDQGVNNLNSRREYEQNRQQRGLAADQMASDRWQNPMPLSFRLPRGPY